MNNMKNTQQYFDLLGNLCYYDARNPENLHIVEGEPSMYLQATEEKEIKTLEQQEGCACDNCFYGRSKLANQFLDYIETHSQPNKLPDRVLNDQRKLWDVENPDDVKVCGKCGQPNEQVVRNKENKHSYFVCGCNWNFDGLHTAKKKFKRTVIHPPNNFQQIIGNPRPTDIQ